MTGKTEQVKLLVYEMHGNEIVVDSITAKDFDDFILIEVDPSMVNIDIDQLTGSIDEVFKDSKKQILIVPRNAEIGFYGFREINTPELSE